MTRDEFKKFIESIGFVPVQKKIIYDYKIYRIIVKENSYDFYNGWDWRDNISMDDLNILLKITRRIKLKRILK